MNAQLTNSVVAENATTQISWMAINTKELNDDTLDAILDDMDSHYEDRQYAQAYIEPYLSRF